MSLKYILDKVAGQFGIDTTNTTERAKLVDLVNEAARDLYTNPDAQLPIALQEVYVRVEANKEMALPPFVGELRAIREGCLDYCTEKWELHTMLPKYHKTEWKNQWKNWRDKGYCAIAYESLDGAPGEISIPTADPTLTVTIQGETEDSNKAIDIITMDAVSKTWTKTWTHIKQIEKNKVTSENITITDVQGNELAIIYADQLKSRYKLVDVSQYPTHLGCCTCDDGSNVFEVLYKPTLNIMQEDSDFFPVDGFDDVLVVKVKQLLTEMEPGKESRAILMHQKAKTLIRQLGTDKTGNLQKVMKFKANPIYGRMHGQDWD